jgi:hypothetical protein
MRLPRLRFTLRRLMVYVAVFAVVPLLSIWLIIALRPRFEAAALRWEACRSQASHSNQVAAMYRNVAARYPADIVIPGVTVRRTEHGPVIPATGAAAARMAVYHAERARLYERAKWRVWAALPPEPPWPELQADDARPPTHVI